MFLSLDFYSFLLLFLKPSLSLSTTPPLFSFSLIFLPLSSLLFIYACACKHARHTPPTLLSLPKEKTSSGLVNPYLSLPFFFFFFYTFLSSPRERGERIHTSPCFLSFSLSRWASLRLPGRPSLESSISPRRLSSMSTGDRAVRHSSFHSPPSCLGEGREGKRSFY